MAEPVDDC